MKQFEDKFTNHIKATFEAYQEEVDPSAFEDIQRRLRQRRRDLAWLPWIWRGIAVSVPIIISLMVYHFYFGDDANNQRDVTHSISVTHGNEKPVVESHTESVSTPPMKEITNSSMQSTGTISSSFERKTTAATIAESELQKQMEEWLLSDHNDQTNASFNNFIKNDKFLDEDIISQFSSEDEVKDQPNLYYIPFLPQIKVNPTSHVLFELGILDPIEKVNQPGFVLRKESAFSLVAAFQTNMLASGLVNGLGFKLGGRYQIPIYKGFGIQTGLLFSRVNLGYDPNSYTSKPLSHIENDFSTNIPAYEIKVDEWTQADLWSIEIPIQIVYSWRNRSSALYQAGIGLSSFWQIHERFETEQSIYTFEQFKETTSTQFSITNTEEATIVEEFSTFHRLDPLVMMNFNFTFPLRLKNQFIYIEPFIQIPLGVQTSQGISYGSGGVQLIIPFHNTK